VKRFFILVIILTVYSLTFAWTKAEANSITKWFDGEYWYVKGTGRISGSYLTAESFFYEYTTDLQSSDYYYTSSRKSGFINGNYFLKSVSLTYSTRRNLSGNMRWIFTICVDVVWYCNVIPNTAIFGSRVPLTINFIRESACDRIEKVL